MKLDLARELSQVSSTKIVLCVLDGLGGLARSSSGKTELEEAHTPNLDQLAGESEIGSTIPVGIGITPGSGPGHLALFGYDPLEFDIGRGVLEATGIEFQLGPNDVAARGNFCTLDSNGEIIDRRAGRIESNRSKQIVELLRSVEIEGVDLYVEPVREHRFVLVLKGEGLGEYVSTTDPQIEGAKPIPAQGMDSASKKTAEYVNTFVAAANDLLAESGEKQANGLVLRGFAKVPLLPQLDDIWKLRCAALAVYPMYRGLASLAGMETLACPGGMAEQLAVARDRWDDFDYFFIHYKKTDAAGEDGDFEAKVQSLEEFDKSVPAIRELGADVLMIAGDHSTPAVLAGHSWHPVPFLLNSAHTSGKVGFSEDSCRLGALGTFSATEVLPLAMAHAGKLQKYGA